MSKEPSDDDVITAIAVVVDDAIRKQSLATARGTEAAFVAA
jgi:hypothetical protein